jgi:hypothetical protein
MQTSKYKGCRIGRSGVAGHLRDVGSAQNLSAKRVQTVTKSPPVPQLMQSCQKSLAKKAAEVDSLFLRLPRTDLENAFRNAARMSLGTVPGHSIPTVPLQSYFHLP